MFDHRRGERQRAHRAVFSSPWRDGVFFGSSLTCGLLT
jgi:hypothetical protein